MNPVTDPELISQLEGGDRAIPQLKPVTDPGLIATLNAPPQAPRMPPAGTLAPPPTPTRPQSGTPVSAVLGKRPAPVPFTPPSEDEMNAARYAQKLFKNIPTPLSKSHMLGYL